MTHLAPSWSTPAHERPAWRGGLHAVAFLLTVPAGLWLVLVSTPGVERLSTAVYAMSLLLAFGTSAAYHRMARTERAGLVLQRLDHSMIFVLIAGSYTPICVVALPRSWGVPMLWIAWSVAAVGVTVKTFSSPRLRSVGTALYPILGWAAVVVMPTLARSVTAVELALVIASGLTYTIGIPVLLSGRPDPWPRTFGYHEVWHALTVVAAALHFVAVSLIVT